MITRPIQHSDIPRLIELWEQKGFKCGTPDFTLLHGEVLVDDGGVIRMAIADRMTAEAYMFIDRSKWESPGMKFLLFGRLHEAARRSLLQRGITDIHSWVPRCARSFARKLGKFFGWVNSSGPDGSWTGLTRDL